MSSALAPLGSLSVSPYPASRPAAARSRTDSQEPAANTDEARADEAATTSNRTSDQRTPAEERQIQELKRRDANVRAHEAAHVAAGGSLVGPAQFTYQTGPDQQRYAVGGEVSIDSGAEDKPDATITKMRTVKAAALAPADPSGQDLSVAAQAERTSAEAQAQLARLAVEKSAGKTEADKTEPARNSESDETATGITTQQKRATSGYAQAIATVIAQITGSGINASA